MTRERERASLLRRACLALAVIAIAVLSGRDRSAAQSAAPEILDRSLTLRTVVAGLTTPIGIAFIGHNDLLVLEKDTGRVQRVVDGVVMGTVLDLGVNSSSERGLLGIALHPRFPRDRGVYLYWTCRSAASPTDPFFPDEHECLDTNMFLPDSSNILQVPLLGIALTGLSGTARRCSSIAISSCCEPFRTTARRTLRARATSCSRHVPITTAA